MKTIICDVDGTLTDMQPIEKAVLSQLKKEKINRAKYYARYNRAFSKLLKNELLPRVAEYPLVSWVRKNKNLHFIYATGGMKKETEYVLKKFQIINCFDLKNSLSKDGCRFSKKSGIPFKILKKKFGECLLITDSENDCIGARKAGISFMKLQKESGRQSEQLQLLSTDAPSTFLC